MNGKWDVKKVMLIGVGVSPLFLIGSSLLNGEQLPTNPSELIGLVLGGMIGGALLFGLIAVIRNLFSR